MHHFEVIASEVRGEDFQIVLRNSITGHQMMVTGSALGLAMTPERRLSDVDIGRLAGSVANAFSRAEARRPAKRVTQGAASSPRTSKIPNALQRQLDRTLTQATRASEAAIQRLRTDMNTAKSEREATRILKRTERLLDQNRRVLVSLPTRRERSATPRQPRASVTARSRASARRRPS